MRTESQRVLVTGGAGFIGAALVDRLSLDRGCDVVAIDNGRSGDWARVHADVERLDQGIEGLSVEDWVGVLGGVDLVFHLAAEKYNSSKSTPERLLETNVAATERLIRASSEVGAKIVFTSSLYAYGSMGPDRMSERDTLTPTTLYGASKAMGEYMLRTAERSSGLRWSVARLFFIYGPHQHADGGYKSVILHNFERLAAGLAPTVHGDGKQALDYVYIQDCLDALELLAGEAADGVVANVATGTAISVADLTDVMITTADSELEPIFDDPDWTAGSVRSGDPELMRDRFGWSATTSIEAGLGRVWDWMSAS